MKSTRYTREVVDQLATTDFFKKPGSPACVAILPFVKPEHVGVEIGVFMGTSSTVFLEHCAKMYLIDPCETYEGGSDPGYFSQAEGIRLLLKPYGDRAVFLEMMSADAVPIVPEVDFVFVDGNHFEHYVSQDIALYWPKIHKGGFISGHDYDQVGVRTVVHEFAEREKLKAGLKERIGCVRVVLAPL